MTGGSGCRGPVDTLQAVRSEWDGRHADPAGHDARANRERWLCCPQPGCRAYGSGCQTFLRTHSPADPTPRRDRVLLDVGYPMEAPVSFQSPRPGWAAGRLLTSDLQKTTQNDDEAAFVVAHEAGHRTGGRLDERIVQVQTGFELVSLINGALKSGPEAGVGSVAPSKAASARRTRKWRRTAFRAGNDPARGTGHFNWLVEAG